MPATPTRVAHVAASARLAMPERLLRRLFVRPCSLCPGCRLGGFRATHLAIGSLLLHTGLHVPTGNPNLKQGLEALGVDEPHVEARLQMRDRPLVALSHCLPRIDRLICIHSYRCALVVRENRSELLLGRARDEGCGLQASPEADEPAIQIGRLRRCLLAIAHSFHPLATAVSPYTLLTLVIGGGAANRAGLEAEGDDIGLGAQTGRIPGTAACPLQKGPSNHRWTDGVQRWR